MENQQTNTPVASQFKAHLGPPQNGNGLSPRGKAIQRKLKLKKKPDVNKGR